MGLVASVFTAGAAGGAQAPVLPQLGRNGVAVRDCRAEEGTGTFLALTNATDQGLFVSNDLARARQATNPANTDFQSTGNRLPGKR